MKTRHARLKLLGDGWHTFGETHVPELPEDRVIIVTEHEAAAFLRYRGSTRSVEFLGWVEPSDEPESDHGSDPDG